MKSLLAKLEAATEGSRFLEKVEVNHSGCWLWMASCNRKGYGQFSVGRKTDKTHRMLKAHRYAYAVTYGQIPPDLQIDHLCKNPRCVRPDHLEAVTSRINNARSDSPSAVNARREVCQQGHPFGAGNLYTRPNGGRECRICKRQSLRNYRAALRTRGETE